MRTVVVVRWEKDQLEAATQLLGKVPKADWFVLGEHVTPPEQLEWGIYFCRRFRSVILALDVTEVPYLAAVLAAHQLWTHYERTNPFRVQVLAGGKLKRLDGWALQKANCKKPAKMI